MIWHRDGKPFNAAQLRKEALPALLPRDLTEKHFLDAGAKRLVEQERPVYNPETHNGYSVIEDVNGIPTKRWIVEPRPKEEVETKRAAEKRNAELREDAEAIRSDEGVVSLLTGRPDDIERYIEERVTADAEVKKVLVALAKATSLLMQGQLRR